MLALQTQAPLTHFDPAPHAGPVPQRHVPVIELQPSANVGSHGAHAAPPIAQALTVGGVQAPFAQQPPGHDCALQVQAPPMQTVPAPQARPVPQRQSPAVEQLFARVGSQVTQADPLDPHAVMSDGVQVAPEQQPLGQLAALQPLHTPAEQLWPPQS